MREKTSTKAKSKLYFPDLETEKNLGSLEKISSRSKGEKEKISLKKREGKPKFDYRNMDSVTATKISKGLDDLEKTLTDLGIEKEGDLVPEPEITSDRLKKLAGIENKPKEPLPATIQNLPKILNMELTKHGTHVYPEWTPIRDLPGYMKGSIRAFGRKIFEILSPGTKLEDFLVISTVGRLNTDQELNAVANYLKNNGTPDREKSGKIIDLLPDYEAKVIVYRAGGYVWLVIQDFAGKYIYAAEDRGKRIEYKR